MSKVLLAAPTNVTEMVALQTYIDKARLAEVKALEEAVDESKKR